MAEVIMMRITPKGRWHRHRGDDPASSLAECGVALLRSGASAEIRRVDDHDPDVNYCLPCDSRYQGRNDRLRARKARIAARNEPEKINREVVLREARRAFEMAFPEGQRAESLVRAIEKGWPPEHAVSPEACLEDGCEHTRSGMSAYCGYHRAERDLA